MKRFFFLLVPLVLGACAMVPQPPSKGALVKVYRANPVKEGLVCSVGGDQGLSFIYVGAQTVSGDVGDEDKRVIAQYAKSVLGETRFINAMGVPAGEGEYPDLSIRVHSYRVDTKKSGERVTRDGKFQASFSIKQAGMLECATSDPVLVEKHYEAPSYSAEKLPTIARVQEQMVKEAVRQVVRQFVPTTSTELRPIKGGSELAENAGKMIDGGNCSGAYEGIKAVAHSQQTNDANLLYNAGVALECMAWNAANDQKAQVDYLKKAQAMYQRAAFLRPGDADMQKAAKEVTYEVETFFASFERQKKTRDTLKQYQGPKSY